MHDDQLDGRLRERLVRYETGIPVGDPQPPSSAEPRGTRPAAFLGLGALGAVAAIVLAVVVLRVSPDDVGVMSPPPTPSPESPGSSTRTPAPTGGALTPGPTSAPVSSTPTETLPGGPPNVAWEPVDFDPTSVISGLFAIDGRWFAAGSVSEEAAVWISDDARRWTRAQVPSATQGEQTARITHILPVDGRLVGLGSWGRLPSDQFARLVFTSVDRGVTWERTLEDQQFAPRAAVAGGPGIVGIGWTYAGTLPFDSISMASRDGSAWTEYESPGLAGSQVNDVTALGSRVVAVGHAFSDSQPAAWISDDGGASWRRVTLGTVAGSTTGSVETIVRFGERLIAVGASNHLESPIPTAWVSNDGETWQVEIMGAAGTARALATGGDGLVATGSAAGASPDDRPLAWSSADGVLWSDAGLPSDDVVLSSAVGDGDTILVGGVCRDGCASPLWLGTLARATE